MPSKVRNVEVESNDIFFFWSSENWMKCSPKIGQDVLDKPSGKVSEGIPARTRLVPYPLDGAAFKKAELVLHNPGADSSNEV